MKNLYDDLYDILMMYRSYSKIEFSIRIDMSWEEFLIKYKRDSEFLYPNFYFDIPIFCGFEVIKQIDSFEIIRSN